MLAGYARYLKGIDDNGKAFEISPDPMLAELQAIVAPLEVKEGEQDFSCLKNLYSRADVFGVDLYEVGLGEQIEGHGQGAVRWQRRSPQDPAQVCCRPLSADTILN